MDTSTTLRTHGPRTAFSDYLHQWKYRSPGETFEERMTAIANELTESSCEFFAFRDILLDQRFLPAGRIQSAVGSTKRVTPFNCFVSRTIPDSMDGIMLAAKEAAETMRQGGGIGYDFSTLRPEGDLIRSLQSRSSGPISFMGIFDAICKTIASAGHRRGAQMGVLRVDHPDVESFIRAKHDLSKLTAFNVSLGITDEFMRAVQNDAEFDLRFDGETYKTIRARILWEEVMRSTWDYAEPGVLFIDRINEFNNLWYCEDIRATNPCAEQPLPPFGACLLGSFNLPKYLTEDRKFNYRLLREDMGYVVRAMDHVNDVALFPLTEQRDEALSKRRMGLGVTGLANCVEAMGYVYGTEGFLDATSGILFSLSVGAYLESVYLARERGSFPMYHKESYLDSRFIQTLPKFLQRDIAENGIRNSHLLSIAPTGTISSTADNVSSGIEPVFAEGYDRTVQTEQGPRVFHVEDYGTKFLGVTPRTCDQLSAQEHVDVLNTASRYVDSSVSKTCNVSPRMPWEDFKDLYFRAWMGGAKGCTTFNPGGKRMGILVASAQADEDVDVEDAVEGEACYYDPTTGLRSCEG